MSSTRVRIGIDLMGNDNSPETLLAALQKCKLPANIDLVYFGLPEFNPGDNYVECPTFIAMDESPLSALRHKKNATICEGLRHLKDKKINAFVSAGNTGALVSGAKMILGNMARVQRPALLARMPTKKKPIAVLDVGANVQAKASHLIQYAYLGAAYCRVQGIENPTIGLLNIGSEAIKGTSELRLAYKELQKATSFRFAGNIEGKSVFDGDVDVLVTDGFTGNVFLKTAEGFSNLILGLYPQIQGQQINLDYAEHPGALIAGVRGIVIKCHGYSTPTAFVNAVLGSIDLASREFSQAIEEQMV